MTSPTRPLLAFDATISNYVSGPVLDGWACEQEHLYAYVVAHGQEFAAAPRPSDVRQRAAGRCFDNAVRLVLSSSTLRYCEGFARHSGDSYLHHGWAITEHDTVVDPTWSVPERRRYFGVAFTRTDDLNCDLLEVRARSEWRHQVMAG